MPPTLQRATANTCLCWSLLDIHGQVWVSLLWGHCSFLLGPSVHKILFVPSKSLFPQSSVSSGNFMMGQWRPPPRGLMPYPGLLYPEPLPLQQSTADPYLHRRHSNTVLSQSWCTHGLFEPSEHLWGILGLSLNVILPLLPSCWGFFLLLDVG